MQQKKYNCVSCNKSFIDRSGLWRHRKKCSESLQQQTTRQGQSVDMSVVLELLKQNQEFKELLVEQNNQLRQVIQSKLL